MLYSFPVCITLPSWIVLQLNMASTFPDFFSSNYIPTDPKEFAGRIFVTCYMGTENSSEETRKRASNLAEEIGSHHMGKVRISSASFYTSSSIRK